MDTAGIVPEGTGWLVPSESTPGLTYRVDLNDEDRPFANRGDFHDEGPLPWSRDPSCTCMNHLVSAKAGQMRRNRCKHIVAVFQMLAERDKDNGTYLDATPGMPGAGTESTFWCTRHQRDEPLSQAPWESQLRGVLWQDHCDAAEDLPGLETPNEPDEALRPVYEALRRMGKELAELKRRGPPRVPVEEGGQGITP